MPPLVSLFGRALRCAIGRCSRLGRAGAVAIVTAICSPILVMVVGFAADYGYASYINQQLSRATDAATLSSVSQTVATAVGGYSALAYLQYAGVQYFNANIAQTGITGAVFTLTVVSDGAGGVIANGKYTYNVPTFFAGILGFNSIPISGSVTATAKPLVYVNYYILVDTSQSMGIASTAADMTALAQLVVANKNQSGGEQGCVFGCHVKQPSNFGGLQPFTNEYLAHANGVTLRIDSAITAIQSIIAQAQAIAGSSKNVAFGLYEIQKNPNNSNSMLTPTNNNMIVNITPNAGNAILQNMATTSTNYGLLQTAASSIDLGDNQSGGIGDSDFPNELSVFNTMLTNAGITTNGNGSSPASPLNYVFIITDGATDTYGNCNGRTHCTSAFDPANCTALKTKATVGTIYTIWNDIYTNNDQSQGLEYNYAVLVKGFKDQIGPNLQSCATSSDYYFPANEGPEIIAAMQALFARTQSSSARITN